TIAETIGELLAYFEDKKSEKPLPIISAIENKPYYGNRVKYYGTKDSADTKEVLWSITKANVSRAGTEVTVASQADEFSFFTPLYGAHQCSNALPAFWLGEALQAAGHTISLQKIAQAAATIPYIYQRHEPHFAANDGLILDNSYNTNP